MSAREEVVVAVALVAASEGGEEVVGSVAAAELVLSGGGELELRVREGGGMGVVVEHEVGDGFSGEFGAAFEDDVEMHH